MNCDWVKENAALYIYEELADDQRHEFEQHVERCAACKQELAAARDFKMTMSAIAKPEPSPNLLAASRMKLQEALETAQQSQGWSRFAFDIAGWLQQVRLAPALTMALLVFGFAGGVMTTYGYLHNRGGSIAGPAIGPQGADQASVASITGITQDPNSNKVHINYSTLVPATKDGSLDDPAIQQ